jgi:hypothetical protein
MLFMIFIGADMINAALALCRSSPPARRHRRGRADRAASS